MVRTSRRNERRSLSERGAPARVAVRSVERNLYRATPANSPDRAMLCPLGDKHAHGKPRRIALDFARERLSRSMGFEHGVARSPAGRVAPRQEAATSPPICSNARVEFVRWPSSPSLSSRQAESRPYRSFPPARGITPTNRRPRISPLTPHSSPEPTPRVAQTPLWASG
jgi:hypothetical protein